MRSGIKYKKAGFHHESRTSSRINRAAQALVKRCHFGSLAVLIKCGIAAKIREEKNSTIGRTSGCESVAPKVERAVIKMELMSKSIHFPPACFFNYTAWQFQTAPSD
jgi:hypothetical protein